VVPQYLLVAVGLWIAWRPCETVAASPVVLALVALALVPWAHARTSEQALAPGLAVAVLALGYGAATGWTGWDRSTAAVELALAAAIVAFAWLGSRRPGSERLLGLFALGLAALSLWALWQVGTGFERAHAAVAELPELIQENAAARLASGRAFASLLLPGHLGVLLATALPLLLLRLRASWRSIPWALGCGLALVGLVLTQSPIAIGLGAAASIALIGRRRSRLLVGAASVLVVGLALAFVFRSELSHLEPLRLRADNWRTAGWLWSTSPLTGVGLGSYGQASQAVPFEVGNRPLHAHSLPMEWAAELGVVGIAAAVMAAWWLLDLVRRLWPRRPELAVAVTVIPLHNLVDFSLYTSGVAIPWALLAGWAMAAAGPRPTLREDRGRRLLLVATAGLAVAVAVLHSTSVTVAEAALSADDPRDRLRGSLRAHRLAPWRIEPVVAGAAAAIQGTGPEPYAAGRSLLAAGRRLRPRSATLSALASRLELAEGRAPSALSQAWLAVRAQPSFEPHRDAFDDLLSILDAESDARAR
jgi:hypothetical protein